MNANDALLTAVATAQTGSTVPDIAPNAPASASFDLIILAAAGSAWAVPAPLTPSPSARST